MKKLISAMAVVTLFVSLLAGFQGNPPAALAAEVQQGVWYKIINRNSGKVLEISSYSNEDGANAAQWALNGGNNQQWKFSDAGNGYYTIVNRSSQKVLDVLTSSTANGGNVVQWTSQGSTNQQWKLESTGGGYYKIINRKNGKVLDVTSQSTQNGSNIVQWTSNGGKNQQWYLIAETTGNITYTLVRQSNPTADQKDAYNKIKAAMDTAVMYYNNLTNISKQLTVYYNTSVATADASINGTIRFGSSRSYMDTCTAMHEISHTVGVGQSSGWFSHIVDGKFTGTNAVTELCNITGNSTEVLHGDKMHFWPYGLNYSSEVKTDADYINHCRMVNMMKKDGI